MTPQEYAYLDKIAREYSKSPGDILVAGTMDGEDVRTFQRAAPHKNILVIDSFEGLAPAEPEDINSDHMVAGECNIGGLEAYLELFRKANMTPPKEIYKMWIADRTLEEIPLRPLCIMFLDLDHYAPTKACLERFARHVIDGGVILVHDYDFIRCPGIKKCCDEFGGRWVKIEGTGLARYYPLDLKIEIGSGVHPTPGYTHLDIAEGHPHLELCAPADAIPVDSGVVSELLSVNILEHIEWSRVRPVLNEWSRVVAHGGTIKIHVPDMLWLINFFGDADGAWKRDAGVQPFNAAEDKWEYFNHYVMSIDAPYNLHRSVYTQEFLEKLLSEVGFHNFIRLHTDPRWLYLQATKG